MQIREFKNAAGRTMVECIRHTYDPERGRGVAKRLGRFQVDVVRSADRLAVRRQFTAAEDRQFLEWWAPHQAKIEAATERGSIAARAQRQANIIPDLERAISAVEASLQSGQDVDPAACWRLVDQLSRTLRSAGAGRPPKATRPAVVEDDRQTDLEAHIAARLKAEVSHGDYHH